MYCNKTKYTLKAGLSAVMMSLLLSGCGGGGGSSSSTGASPTPSLPSSVTALTIDDAGIVPLIDNNPTSSVIYVHNNTDKTISNITYSSTDSNQNQSFLNKSYKALLNKVLGVNSSPAFINSISAAQCATIPAHTSCALGFTTPQLSSYAAQGSTIINANYISGGKPGTFSQIVSYADVSSTASNGVQIMSGAVASGFINNKTGYSTIYAYGSGKDQHFKVNSLSTNLPNTAIANGNPSGLTIQSGFVQAIEVSGSVSTDSAYTVGVNLQSTDTAGTKFTAEAPVTVVNPTTDPKVIIGLVSVIDTFDPTSGSGMVNIVNTSTLAINDLQVTGQNGVSIVTQCTGGAIGAGSGCSINFTTPQFPGSGTVSVTGGTTTGPLNVTPQSVIWFNSKNSPLLGMQSSINPLQFIGSSTTGGTATITVTNLGGYDVTGLDVTGIDVVTGMAKASLVATTGTNTCGGQTVIARNGVCSYQINVTDSIQEQGTIKLLIKGNYMTETGLAQYSRTFILGYISGASVPVLTFNALTNMQINGDSLDVANQQVVVSNNGNVDANLKTFALNLQNTFQNTRITLSSTTCENRLLSANGGTCTMNLVLGPQANVGTAPLVDQMTVHGTFTGGTVLNGAIDSNGFNSTVNLNGQNLTISNVTASGSTSGDGTAVNPYIFSGSNPAVKSLVITYQNSGTNPIMINGFDNVGILPTLWLVVGGTDTCTNQVLNPSQACTITYTNQLAKNFLAVTNVGVSTAMNLQLPGVVFTDQNVGSKFYATPAFNNQAAIAVTGQQAAVVNQVTQAPDGSTVTVTHSVSNATGYPVGSIKVSTSMENYFIKMPPASECVANTSTDGSTVNEICGFANIVNGNETIATVYQVNQTLASNMILHLLYEAIPQGNVFFSLMPQRDATPQFPAELYSRAYIVNNKSATDNQIVLCQIDTKTGSPTQGQFTSCANALANPSAPDFNLSIKKISVDGQYAFILFDNGSSQVCAVGSNYKLSNCNATPNLPNANPLVDIKLNNGSVYFADNTNNQVFVCQVINNNTAINLNCTTPASVGVAGDIINSIYFANNKAYVSYHGTTGTTSSLAVCPVGSGGTLDCTGTSSQTITSFPADIKAFAVNSNSIIAIQNTAGQQYACGMLGATPGDIDATTCATIPKTGIPTEIITPDGIDVFSGNYYYSGQSPSALTKCSFDRALPAPLTCTSAMAPGSPDIFTGATAMAFVQ